MSGPVSTVHARALLAPRTVDSGAVWVDTKIILKPRKH